MGEKSPTDELIAMLDRYGIEHDDHIGDGFIQTIWTDQNGGTAEFTEHGSGCSLRLYSATPEQAVEATLGRGKCRIKLMPMSGYHCTACGELVTMYDANDMLRRVSYCPCCGREVV